MVRMFELVSQVEFNLKFRVTRITLKNANIVFPWQWNGVLVLSFLNCDLGNFF